VRRFARPHGYSLLGITHTTATAAVMDSIGNLSVAPIEPWDAVICTSAAVRNTYAAVLAAWQDYLADRLGAQRIPQPMLPVIPLGIDCAGLAPADAPQLRALWRQRYGVADDDLVVLWMGRLNHLSKAHPLPGYLVLQALAEQDRRRRLFFFQAGHFASAETGQAFREAARRFAPDVRHVFLDGREPLVRAGIWHAADIFLSLSDNIQETFGLTPVEAMAAGLPVVASDWDGYRDTVRDGIDGIMIPTLMPAPGHGEDIALGFAAGSLGYNGYAGVLCQSIAVDLRRTTDALAALAADAGLRRRMGEAGRQRAREVFDWRVIIGRLQALLAELAAIRGAAPESTAPRRDGAPAFPLRGDPFAVFATYPTQALSAATPLAPGPMLGRVELAALLRDPLNAFAAAWRAPEETLQAMLAQVVATPGITAAALIDAAAPDQPALSAGHALRGLAFLVKMGVLDLAA
jgi:glycosyltransferase involved in cell wall biosynthesis